MAKSTRRGSGRGRGRPLTKNERLEHGVLRALEDKKPGVYRDLLFRARKRLDASPDPELAATIARCDQYVADAEKRARDTKARKAVALAKPIQCTRCLRVFQRKSIGQRMCPNCQIGQSGPSVRTVSGGLPGLGRSR